MMYAVLDTTNTIVNVVEDSSNDVAEYKTPVTYISLPEDVWVGHRLVNSQWLSPSEMPWNTITASQGRKAIYAAGLRSAVEAAVASAGQATQDLWYTAETLDRNNPTVIGLATAIGLTSDELDELFMTASNM